MESYRTSQGGLVRYLKRSIRITSPRVERALLGVDRKHFVDSSVPPYVVYQVHIQAHVQGRDSKCLGYSIADWI